MWIRSPPNVFTFNFKPPSIKAYLTLLRGVYRESKVFVIKVIIILLSKSITKKAIKPDKYVSRYAHCKVP